MDDREYVVIDDIEVSVRQKVTFWNANADRLEDANVLLKEKAKELGADAVINVKYKKDLILLGQKAFLMIGIRHYLKLEQKVPR